MRIAKRDLVPTMTNLREVYAGFTELEAACAEFMSEVNGRVHRDTRQRPVDRLGQERARLHPVPDNPFTACFGETRRVGKDSTVSVGATLGPRPTVGKIRDIRRTAAFVCHPRALRIFQLRADLRYGPQRFLDLLSALL